MLCIMSLMSFNLSAQSQNLDGETQSDHWLFYGVHLDFTGNMVDLYHTLNGEIHAYGQDSGLFFAPGFRIATTFGIHLGDHFSLRVMPGVSMFSSNWKPNNFNTTALSSSNYTVESVLGELPVDIKFRSFRIGNVEPYIALGLKYSFDFASLRKGEDIGNIQPLNTHDLHYTVAWGVDWYTRCVKIGFEIKLTHGILSPGNGGNAPFYFHNRSVFSLGIRIEA
mgnify:FL=1